MHEKFFILIVVIFNFFTIGNLSVWTACGDSIVRAFDAKSGTIKRSFVGHEAAVNCMTLTSGKLYTGSSDGTLRIWDAKDVSDEMVDDGPPPPLPEGHAGEEAEVVETGPVDVPAEEPQPPADDVDAEAEVVEDLEAGEPGEEAAEADEAAENPEEAEGEGEAPADEEEAKDVDDLDEMERELAAQG